MKKWLFKNLHFIAIGWLLSDVYGIQDWHLWIWMFVLILTESLREAASEPA